MAARDSAMKDFIVAMELGSSKVTGVAGRKNQDGSINVLAVAQEPSSSFMIRGTVYKSPQTVKAITDVVGRLRAKLKQDIRQVYVGIGGQSIHSVSNRIVEDLDGGMRVTDDMVYRMMDSNRGTPYQDKMIATAVTQEYRVDNRKELSPEGTLCSRLEGNFLNILCRSKFNQSLLQCFKEAKVTIAETYLAPMALADSVLTEGERKSGCVLVDIGAGTTTVSVYYRDILRHLAVIPLGGNNITKDITSLKVDEAVAEEMKLRYACAYTDERDMDDNLSYPLDSERTVRSAEFVRIVEARVREIVENVLNQVPQEYSDKLLGGLILTGGGSNLKNMEGAFREYSRPLYKQVGKIRVASFVTQAIHCLEADALPHDGTMNTVLGILAKGDQDCSGPVISENPALFPGQDEDEKDKAAERGNDRGVTAAPPDAEPNVGPSTEKPDGEGNKKDSLFKRIVNWGRKLVQEDDDEWKRER